MTRSEAYVLYLAIKAHFTSKGYDYFKYNGKVPVDWDKFILRKDLYHFERLAKHENPLGFLVANFVADGKFWVGDQRTERASRNYTQWKKRIQSLQYTFKEELKKTKVHDDFKKLFLSIDNDYPQILNLRWSKKISPETFVILIDTLGLHKHLKKVMGHDFLWEAEDHLLTKYPPFLDYDKDHYREIIRNHIQQEYEHVQSD